MKTCTRCGVEKDRSEFAKASAHKDGLQYWCRACNTQVHREWARKNPDKIRAARERQSIVSRRNASRYSRARGRGIEITREEFDAAVLIDRCAICRRHIEPGSLAHHLDHDHVTGQFRGVLCHGCNTSLGHFGDSIETLQAAIAYLRSAADRYDPNAEPLPPTPGRTGRKKI